MALSPPYNWIRLYEYWIGGLWDRLFNVLSWPFEIQIVYVCKLNKNLADVKLWKGRLHGSDVTAKNYWGENRIRNNHANNRIIFGVKPLFLASLRIKVTFYEFFLNISLITLIFLESHINYRLQGLSELTSIIFCMEIIHLDLDVSNYYRKMCRTLKI